MVIPREQVRDQPESLLSIQEVRARTSLSRTEIYRRIKLGRFPSPIRLTPIPRTGRGGRVAWIEGEVTAWIDDKIRAARSTGTATSTPKKRGRPPKARAETEQTTTTS